MAKDEDEFEQIICCLKHDAGLGLLDPFADEPAIIPDLPTEVDEEFKRWSNSEGFIVV